MKTQANTLAHAHSDANAHTCAHTRGHDCTYRDRQTDRQLDRQTKRQRHRERVTYTDKYGRLNSMWRFEDTCTGSCRIDCGSHVDRSSLGVSCTRLYLAEETTQLFNSCEDDHPQCCGLRSLSSDIIFHNVSVTWNDISHSYSV